MTIKINGTNTTASPGITGPDTDTGLVYGTDEVQIVTGGTTRATVDSSGNIGIGNTSPSGPVHSTVSSGVSRVYLEASNSHSFLRMKAGSTSYNSGIEFYSGSTNTANLSGLGSGGLQFEVNGSERLRIQSGGGISFNGDTAAANALDDYEEGTWTPAVGTGTLTASDATYIKIGKLVHVFAVVYNFSNRTSSNTVEITGLPYTGFAAQAAGSMLGRNLDRTAFSVYLNNGTPGLQFYSIGSGDFASLQHQHINSSSASIYFQATYIIN